MLKYAVLIIVLLFAGVTEARAATPWTPEPRITSHCFEWESKNVVQCTIDSDGTADHIRLKLEINGEWIMIDDVWPNNLERNTHQEREGK